MRFGSFPVADCEGATLAHSFKADKLTLKKGRVLTAADILALTGLGVETLIVARLEKDDLDEDTAASAIARSMQIEGIDIAEAGTGRVNFHANVNGVFTVSKEFVDAINKIDPAITFATLSNFESVKSGRMVATVKIIPYAISAASMKMVAERGSQMAAMAVKAFVPKKIAVISTSLPSLKERTIEKTIGVLEQRIAASGSTLIDHQIVPHRQIALEEQIDRVKDSADLIIIFGASAISDIDDIIPSALQGVGGKITRFGMPVDPGNLLMLGALNGIKVLGAPGCARSPAENGFDFILNRLLADIEVTSDDIAGMGVGGLLMEIGSRPQPRLPVSNSKMHVSALVLAAGQSRRMGDDNKLTLPVRGKPMVYHPVHSALEAKIKDIVVVIGHQSDAVEKALEGVDVTFVANPDFADGLSTSLRKGISALSPQITHVLVLLGDMPDIDSAMIGKMIVSAEKNGPSAIVMATHEGKRGNPVLWPRAYFDALENVVGDTGARHIIGQNLEHVIEVELGSAASLDIDTPEAFQAFTAKADL